MARVEIDEDIPMPARRIVRLGDPKSKKAAANHRWYMANREEQIARATIRQQHQRENTPGFHVARVQAVLRHNERNPAKVMLNVMTQRARKYGYPCTITLEKLEQLLAPMTCALTGFKLSWDRSEVRPPLLPSPDKKSHGKGYVSGNVRIVAWVVNRMRGELSDEEFIGWLRVILERLGR
jgi:hypothetical protein